MTTQKTSSISAMGAATPGTRLRQAREAANVSAETMADKLHISEAKLRALEQDQYEKIASDTFVRGYLRSYGKLVGLDGNELIACYNAYLGQLRDTTEQVTQIAEHRKPEGRLPPWVRPAAIVAGLLLLWVLAVNLSEDETPPAAPTATPANEQPPQPAPGPRGEAPEVPTPAMPMPVEPEAEFVPRPVPAAQEPAAAAGQSEMAAPVAAAVGPAAEADKLTLAFSDECWVEVSDAKGDVLFTDLQQAGDNLALDGEAPFKVMLGNARAVVMALNGEPVDVSPEGSRKTLRMMVGRQELWRGRSGIPNLNSKH